MQYARTSLLDADRQINRGLPVLHRYFELRRPMLGLPDLGYWDIYPPLVKSDRNLWRSPKSVS